MAVLVTLLAVVVALLALLVAGLLRSHAEILRALHELGADLDPDAARRAAPAVASGDRPGADEPDAERKAADLAGVTPSGEAISIGVAEAAHPTLLAFLTSGCLTCKGFWDAFSDPARIPVPGGARLVVVTKDGGAESQSRVRELGPPDVPVVMSSAAWDAYDVPVAPYFAYVDGPSSRVLGEGAASTWEHVVALLGQALADAGLEATARGGDRSRPRGDASREARADRDLARAGIHPGHPSLYPRRESDLLAQDEPE
jgi:hypothetical protein